VGIVAGDGRVLEASRIPTRAERPPGRILDDIVDRVRSLPSSKLSPASPVGVGVAGQVDPDGTVLFGPNLNWHDVPLGVDLSRALRRPVSVLNDVQAATYGEWRYGAGRGTDDVVCLFVGTGVGGGIVADGRLRHGASGTAGELGHLTVERNGRRCRCPNSGCLEAYAGGWAIAERARERVEREPARGARLLALAGSPGAISSETVEQAYRARDPLAQELVEETMSYLVCGLVSIVNGINPRTVVLGGGVLEGFPSLVPVLGRQVRARALPAAAEGLRVVPASLGAESGVIGAAAFARDRQPG
jgi:glucokinase